MGAFNPIFRTRIDEPKAARFYFSSKADAEAFATFFKTEATESSPPSAGGGLYRVIVPHNNDTPCEVRFDEQIAGAIELGRAHQEPNANE